MKSHLRLLLPLIAIATLPASVTLAATVPFVENFDGGAANWTNAARNPLNFHPSGGPGDSSYVSGTFTFDGLTAANIGEREGSQLVFRGETPRPVPGMPLSGVASEGALFGNWEADGVAEFRVMVRHDGAEPLSLFARFATANNFPGILANYTELVLPGTWTEMVIPIELPVDFTDPQWIPEGPFDPTLFTKIGAIQLGVNLTQDYVGDSSVYNLDVDMVSIHPVPEPTTLASLLMLGASLWATRQWWK